MLKIFHGTFSVISLESSPIANSRTNTSDFPIFWLVQPSEKCFLKMLYAGATSLIGWKSRATCFCCRYFVSLIFAILFFVIVNEVWEQFSGGLTTSGALAKREILITIWNFSLSFFFLLFFFLALLSPFFIHWNLPTIDKLWQIFSLASSCYDNPRLKGFFFCKRHQCRWN